MLARNSIDGRVSGYVMDGVQSLRDMYTSTILATTK